VHKSRRVEEQGEEQSETGGNSLVPAPLSPCPVLVPSLPSRYYSNAILKDGVLRTVDAGYFMDIQEFFELSAGKWFHIVPVTIWLSSNPRTANQILR